MVSLKRIEDRPTPKSVYNFRVYLCAIIAAFAAVMIGYDSAFIGTTIAQASFRAEFGLTGAATRQATLSANIVSTYQGGCFFGALFGYPLGWYLGRRIGLLVTSVIFLVGSAIQCGATSGTGLGIMYAGRFIAGLGIGGASNLTPLYIAEIAPPAIRGQLVGMYEIGWQIGGLVGFWINYGISKHIGPSKKQWLIPFAIQILPGGMFLIGLPFLLESPRWLAQQGKREKAEANLCKLRKLPADHVYIQEEMAMIDRALANERADVGPSFWGPFKGVFGNRFMFQRMLLGTSLFIWQNGTGINAINYYSPTVFRSLGLTGTNTGLLTTGIFGVIKTLGAFFWIFLIIDVWGRRNILMLGSAGGAFSMLVIAIYIAVAQPQANPTTNIPPSGRAAIAFFYIWTVFYSVGWNGTPWVVNSEIFPGSVRTLTQTLAAMSNWLWNFVISRATPTMFIRMGSGGWGVYLFFSLMMIVSVPYVYFLLPETKEIPLDMMNELFAPGLPPRKAWGVVMERLRAEQGLDGGRARAAEKSGSDFKEDASA